MWLGRVSLRTAGPTILVAVVLLGTCIAAAVYLRQEQARTAERLRENVNSRRADDELETALETLLVVLPGGNTQVDRLNGRIRKLLVQAKQFADKEEENRLVDRLKQGFDAYERKWREAQGSGSQPAPDRTGTAVQTLKDEVLPACRALRRFNAHQIDQSEAVHRRKVQWVLWGLVGVGCVGALAGIVLGYGVARGLRRSIYQLSVHIRDAADLLGQDLPAVTLGQDGDFPRLHEQMRGLVQEIEKVIRQLHERELEVLRADQMGAVGQLAAGAAHELRNPLTAIKMLIQTSREEATQFNLPAEDLGIIEQEVRRMEGCLNTFLDFARLPSPQRQPFDLTCLVDRTFALVAGRARHQGVALRFVPSDGAVLVEADPEQIQQVLVNLVLNALDAMPRGGKIEVVLYPPADEHVELSVRDTGPGIPPPVMPRLFQPFVSSKETGLGLGLVVSRRIAEAHGGSLRAANLPQGGACFTLNLPVARTGIVAAGAIRHPREEALHADPARH
jgi:two-component system sensor histidine kinase HydH